MSKKRNDNKSKDKDSTLKTSEKKQEEKRESKPKDDSINIKESKSHNVNDASKVTDASIKHNNKKIKGKKVKKAIVFGSLIVLVISSTSFICLSTTKMQNISYNGIYLDSEHVGRLNEVELKEKLSAILSEKIDNSVITIQDGSKQVTVTPAELGLTYDVDSIVKDIISYNKSGNVLQDTIARLSIQASNHEIEYSPIIDETIIDNLIDKIYDEFYTAPTNAGIKFNGTSITATPEKDGKEVNKIKLKEDLINCINNNFTSTNTINLSFKNVKPVLTKEVAENLEILGTHKTKLPSKTGDRTGNIKLYTSKLNKSVLAPGEEFSCDTRGGSREWSDGYRNAPGYVNGKVVPILAGGICQATSTIYNALLYADMEITERSPHSMPVTYAEIGLDAAIAKDILDLKFKNNTSNPVVVQTYVNDDGYVVAAIWGIPEVPNKKIELVTKKHHSKSADAYKKTYIDGKLVKTELLSRDRYK